MKVQVEEISPVRKRVNVEIPEDQVQVAMDAFYKNLGKKTAIKGFRPGKAPRSILERYFKDYAQEEVAQKLIQETFEKAFSEVSIRPVSSPVVEPGELRVGKPFQYSATVDVKPDLKVEGYVGLKLEAKREEVRDEEIEERLKGIQNVHASLRTLAEPRPVQKGDYVILDYEASVEGNVLEGGKATDVSVEVGKGEFIPEIEERLIGLLPEEEREVEVSFPESYSYEKWAGKKVAFRLRIKEIKEKVLPPLDDEFAKDLGDYASLAELKEKLREELAKAKELALRHRLEEQLVEQLLRTNAFDIPEALVEEQAKVLVSRVKIRMAAQGVELEQAGLSEDTLQNDLRPKAEKEVRTSLILEKIAEAEGLTVSDEEVENRLREMAERYRQKFEMLKSYYEKNGLLPGLREEILSRKTLDFLLQKAEITYL